MWYVLVEVLKEVKALYGESLTERPALTRSLTILVGLILVLAVILIGKFLIGGQPPMVSIAVRGELNSRLTAADMRGAYVCFWPLRGGHSAITEVRPSMVRIQSDDGRFSGRVFVGRSGINARPSGEYAVTILDGQLQAFPDEILPKAYGDPAQTPLRITSLRENIILTVTDE